MRSAVDTPGAQLTSAVNSQQSAQQLQRVGHDVIQLIAAAFAPASQLPSAELAHCIMWRLRRPQSCRHHRAQYADLLVKQSGSCFVTLTIYTTHWGTSHPDPTIVISTRRLTAHAVADE